MNRYPLWKYAIIVIALLIGGLYTLPNLFGEAPAVQVSPAKTIYKVDAALQAKVVQALKEAGIEPTGLNLDGNSLKVRLVDTDTQLKAKDTIQKSPGP